MKRFPIVKHSVKWLIGSAIIAIIGAVLFFYHQNLSIQFTGGMEIKVATTLPNDKVIDEVK